MSNRITDVEIPSRAWSSWIPSEGPRQVWRELEPTEREALEARVRELEPMLGPYHPSEADAVVLALAEMFGGFTSLRQGEDDTVGRLDAARHLLAPFPAWAIVKACADVRANGVWRDGRFDRQWAPSDAEVVAAVRDKMRLYSDQHDNAARLLRATVEEVT